MYRYVGRSPIVGARDIAVARSQLNNHKRRRRLLVCGSAAMLVALAGKVYAQQAVLPPVTVEGKAPKAKPKAVAKAAPKAAPKQTPPPEEPATAAQRERAQQDAPYNTPASVSTATKSDLDTFGAINTGDVLRSMPGTYTRESPNNSGIAVNIRGLEGSGRVDMMLDGVRQNFRFTTHEAQGLLYVDPALLAGIDIQRGAVSTTGGAGALAGSANFRTLAIDDIIKPGNTVGVVTTTSWGSNNQGFTEMISAAARVDAFGIGAAISHHEPNDYKNGDGISVPFTSPDILSGLVKAEIGQSANNRLTLGGVFYHNDFFAQAVEQTIDSQVYTAKYRYTSLTNPLIDFRFNLSGSNLEMDCVRAIAPGGAAGRQITDVGRGADISNVSRFNIGLLKVKAEYGAEYFHDSVDGSNSVNPAAAAGVNGTGESSIGGVFSQTTFSYGIFDLIGAVRYDRYTLDGTFTATNAGGPSPIGLPPGTYTLDKAEGRVDPKITLAAQVTPWLQPYVTYSEAFRPPTIQESLLGGAHPTGGNVVFYPNPFLDPEILKGWEFGANIKADGLLVARDSFRLKADYFNNNIDNYITGVFTAFGQGVFENVKGTSNLQGVELQSSYDANVVFAGLSYTYTHTNLASQLNGLGAQSYLPEHIVVLTGGLRFLDQKLTVGARATLTSHAFIGAINATNPADPFTPGYALVDLFASYKVSDSVVIGANVNNLFDIGYTPALSSPPTVTCTPPGITCNTGLGRTVLLTLKTQF
jgi:hemoglobin/transferrin/lactoferrin receptor protein